MATKEELIKRKEHLIERIIQKPLEFTDKEFLDLVHLGQEKDEKELRAGLNFDDLRKMIIRIFDLNESTLRQESDATKGGLGFLNKRSTGIRQKRYYELIDKGFRVNKDPAKKLIVAEGDSWFQFPVFIKDIIDWLSEDPRYAVYSIAYGGDWFTNILFDEKYIEELSIHRPDVFLISGGGNDFVGSNRISVMVDPNNCNHTADGAEFHKKLLAGEDATSRIKIHEGHSHILPSFYSFLWTIKAQYWKLFDNLQASGKYADMKIITQGYDYVIPTSRYRNKKPFALQYFVNLFAGSGKWLKRPLMIQGIADDSISQNIMRALIFQLNCMFIELATMHGFKNVYHIDCRGTAESFDDWWDEIHLHSEGFEKIAKAFTWCIDNSPPGKVVTVRDVR